MDGLEGCQNFVQCIRQATVSNCKSTSIGGLDKLAKHYRYDIHINTTSANVRKAVPVNAPTAVTSSLRAAGVSSLASEMGTNHQP